MVDMLVNRGNWFLKYFIRVFYYANPIVVMLRIGLYLVILGSCMMVINNIYVFPETFTGQLQLALISFLVALIPMMVVFGLLYIWPKILLDSTWKEKKYEVVSYKFDYSIANRDYYFDFVLRDDNGKDKEVSVQEDDVEFVPADGKSKSVVTIKTNDKYDLLDSSAILCVPENSDLLVTK